MERLSNVCAFSNTKNATIETFSTSIEIVSLNTNPILIDNNIWVKTKKIEVWWCMYFNEWNQDKVICTTASVVYGWVMQFK